MKVTVIGAGAWGTTTAILLAENGHDVTLWTREDGHVEAMERDRENKDFLPGIALPESLAFATGNAVPDSDFFVGAVPTQYWRSVLTAVALPRAPYVSLAKGIEIATGLLPTQIYADVLGADRPKAVLTGPCIAREIAQGLPAAAVVAGDGAELFQTAFSCERFRVYTSTDPLGAELVGALKNVMGLAAGIVDGAQLGDNAKAALLTRGIVEITRLGRVMGAEPETFSGLAGFGDLFTTCVSPYGRNRTTGERLGRGESLEEILQSMKSVTEGVPTTRAVMALAQKHGIEMPITQALHAILFEGLGVKKALKNLMLRETRREH
ncbi:MAG: NAD(P)H-dependent glycerol-3-phosphate dehydrogenase [Planctomycetota bacterium]|jgi:glycerol-3-phosphate dehydrogenase (NAD(P)+)